MALSAVSSPAAAPRAYLPALLVAAVVAAALLAALAQTVAAMERSTAALRATARVRQATYESGRAALAIRFAALDGQLAGIERIERAIAALRAARPARDERWITTRCGTASWHREAPRTVELSERCIDEPLGCR
jgi:hypothetical protein